MGGSYMFGHVTANDWLTIILKIWGAAIIWAVATSLATRIKRKKRKDKDTRPSSLCILGCVLSGIACGFCTLNLVMNALHFDAGFITIFVFFIGGGIVGGSTYGVGNLFGPR